MTFDYMTTIVVGDSIEIDDIGNCFIQASNDDGLFYYMWIQTYLGRTKVLQYGPLILGEKESDHMYCSYNKFDYSEAYIAKQISSFLTNVKYKITQVILIDDVSEIIDKLKPLTGFMEEY